MMGDLGRRDGAGMEEEGERKEGGNEGGALTVGRSRGRETVGDEEKGRGDEEG